MFRAGLLFFPLVAPAMAMASPDPREIADAERAFAAMAEDQGITSAFRAFAADDGILFAPDPTPARALLDQGGEAPGSLRWWPVYAGVALSDDLGFTTGPFISDDGRRQGHGWFFTIWRRQSDGSWRWLLDHGTPTAEAASLGEATALAALPPGRRGGSDAARDLAAIEARLDRGLTVNAAAALETMLADDGRVMRNGAQPAVGRAAFSVALLRGPRRIATTRLGGGLSDAGDLAYSYGSANWQAAGQTARGHYVRLWQRRARGWRLIVDELIARPGPPAARPSIASAEIGGH